MNRPKKPDPIAKSLRHFKPSKTKTKKEKVSRKDAWDKKAKHKRMEEEGNSVDKVVMDVPLFIRLLELSREEIKDDATLQDVATVAVNMSQEGRTLTMQDYDAFEAAMGNGDQEMHEEIELIRKRAGV